MSLTPDQSFATKCVCVCVCDCLSHSLLCRQGPWRPSPGEQHMHALIRIASLTVVPTVPWLSRVPGLVFRNFLSHHVN